LFFKTTSRPERWRFKNWLLEKHGVPEKQLAAQGVASLSPVTSNSTAEGKARNHRVEIVEQ
jgi:OOP family OmpA-OmpF porin